MVREITIDELEKVKQTVSASGADTKPYERAAKIFEEMSTSAQFTEFLTLPLYEEI